MNIKVFGELFFERDQKDPLLDHIIICIYGLLKKHISTLVSTNIKQKDIYNDIKGLILECLKKRYLNLENPTYIMRNYICDCISILIISGITCSWTTVIQDLINEAKNGNPELIFIAIRSIADCNSIMNFYEKESDDNYWDDNLHFREIEKKERKNKLTENSGIIFEFIGLIYSNIDKIEKKLKNRIIKSIIDLITFWTQLNLNILTDNKNFAIVMDLINMTEGDKDKIENLKSVDELINASILSSHNCKIYEFYNRIDENLTPSEVLQSIENNIDKDEKNGINNCLNYIFQKIEEYNNSQTKNENFLWIYAKIFSCFLENYIFLFFDFNNKANGIVFNLLKFFISHKKRKISWMFFNSIDSMMNFITDYYRFYGVNDSKKKEFSNYLLEILKNVMENCAFKKLNPNDYSQLQKSILYKDNESNWKIQDKNELYNNMNENDFDLDDIDLKEYRNSAEHVFYCIYLIFKEGLNKDYEKYFIDCIISLINLEDDNIKNIYDEKNAIKLDIILLVIKSLIPGINIESSMEIIQIINNFIYNLSESVYIQKININIFIDYLLIINKIGNFLVTDKNYFEKAILILLFTSDKKDIHQCLIDSCYKVISNICGDLDGNINFEKIFDVFLDRFKNIYKIYNISNITPLENLISSMFYVMGINEANEVENYKNDKNLISFINRIIEPVNNELHLLLEQKTNINVDFLKLGIIKAFLLYKEFLHHIHFIDSSLRKIISNDFILKTINDLIKIFNIFPNDMDIFNPIIGFYLANASLIGEDCIASFSIINNVFIELFKLNKNYFEIIDFLNIIYRHVLNKLNKNDNNYSEQNKYMTDNFFILIAYSIQYIKDESTFNNQFITKIKSFLNNIVDIFPLLNIQIDQSNNTKNIIKTIINIFKFLIKLIQIILENEKNDEELLSDYLISIIIKSISSIFNENIFKYLLINLSDNERDDLITQIENNSWELVNLKKFNYLSCQELSLLYSQISLSNIHKFCENFRKCLVSKKLFNENYYNNICAYIDFFYKDKEKIIEFIKEILFIIYDGKNPDCLEFYFNQLIKKKNINK